MSHLLDNLETVDRTIALAQAFGATFHVLNREVDGSQTFASMAEALGVTYMSSELGGANRVSLEGLAITRRGVMNAMIHLGITEGELSLPTKPTRLMSIPDSSDYGFSPACGICAPQIPLGTLVDAGDLLAEIHNIEDPLAPPVPLRAPRRGLLWCQRGQGRISLGDSAAVVVAEWTRPEH